MQIVGDVMYTIITAVTVRPVISLASKILPGLTYTPHTPVATKAIAPAPAIASIVAPTITAKETSPRTQVSQASIESLRAQPTAHMGVA